MKITELFKVRPLAVAVSVASLAAANAYAQEDQVTEETVQVQVEQAQEQSADEEIVVTGSRLRRDEFSSISPMQVINADVERDLGNFSAADILQTSTAAQGTQIDLTFSGYVLDNGPGASTLNLRGLGSARSLIIMNGRRLAPAGVEGAPTSFDLNLVPSGMVASYELLLDGASSVYGSDAVAGVANIITRKDFDGFEVSVDSELPTQGGGESTSLNLMWGTSSDRGYITAGVEWQKTEPVRRDDRTWTATCDKNYEVGLDGKFYQEDLFYSEVYGMEVDNCKTSSLAGRTIVPYQGSIYYTPGYSNGLWPDFSESTFRGAGVDGNGDGKTDVNFKDYTLNGKTGFAHLFPEVERVAFMAAGEYTFDGDSNITPFFELLYAKRENYTDGGAYQLFPNVPANNPYNLCNPNGVNGVDCLDALTPLYGVPSGTFGFMGPADTLPVVNVRGDRTTSDVSVAQTRFVLGTRGDLPFMNFGSFSDWFFEVAASASYSEGKSSRYGIRGDRLDLSLTTTIEDPNNAGSFICGVDNDGDGIPDGTDGCVPINMYAPSLYENVIGDFATAAERNYLFDSRDFDTKYYQNIVTAFISGTVFSLPAGDVSAAIGAEYRYDKIESLPDDVAANGLFFGYFSDGGATGDKTTTEFFGEVSMPLLANAPMVTELNLDLSTRYTKDEYYGGAWTGGAKLGYRPIDSVLLRATYGTSYRAPNLRELFLKDQTGFNTVFDPCGIPDDALVRDPNDPTAPVGYDPSKDTRSPEVLANCLANGVDPTDPAVLDTNGFNSYSVEIATGGRLDLEEETSTSYTYGMVFDQPWWNEFDMSFGVSYYEIEVENAIVEPSAQFLVNDCYNSEIGSPSIFCGDLQRGSDNRIELVTAGFINRDLELTRGIDFDYRYSHDLTVADMPISLGIQVRANRLLESKLEFQDDDGNIDSESYQGEFGYAEWTGNTQLSLQYEDWSFAWGTRFIGAVEQDPDGIDPYSDIYDTNGTGFYSDSCIGVANGGTDCRDVGFAEDYLIHSFSLSYRPEAWGVTLGLRNAFNKAPPRVDSNEVLAVNNTPIGAGYDLQGRTVFLSLDASF